ncbi:MAG: M23 family metallopeptidase [bacterium]|nr:M23 family metallopeptidase [bacterium]
MREFRLFIRRHALFVALLLFMLVSIAGGTYFAGILGVSRPPLRSVETRIPTVLPPLPGTSVDRYFQLDPAIVDYLNNRQPSYSAAVVDVFGLDIQPIGAFLPRTGNTQFNLAAPTPLPTPLPYPTSPPLPVPPLPTSAVPTVPPEVATAETFRTLPYIVPENVDCAPAGRPVDGLLTQRFHLTHPGIDLALPLGSPVFATHSGQVIFADWSEIGYGYLVIVQSGPFISYYAHNTSFNVLSGQLIGKGSIVAWSGSTGNSSGPHVHYETRINDIPVDPLTFDSRGYPSC